jgi:hypothetical protein
MVAEKDSTLTQVEVYRENGANFRYFLGWRERLFAGHLAILAGLSIGFSWMYENTPNLCWLALFAVMLITFVCWLLECRVRDLYHACQEVGWELEKSIELDCEQGIYGKLDSLRRTRTTLTHSRIIDIFFKLILFMSFIAMLYCKWKY